MERAGIAKGLTVAVVLVIVVAGLASIFVASYLGRSGSATSSTTETTSSQSATASGPLTILVSRTTVDKTNSDSPAGSTLYVYDLTLTGNSSSTESFGPSFFTLTGASGTSYNASTSLSSIPLYAGAVAMGQRSSGELAFSVPDSDQPSKLAYNDPALRVYEVVTDLPAASRWVSTVAGVQAAWPSTTNTANFFIGASIVNSTSDIYYSGGTIKVEVQITPVNDDDIVGVAVPDVTVKSVAVENPGFSVVSVSPSLPITVTANNNTAATNIIVTIALPDSSLSVGTLSLSLSAG